MDRNSIIFDGEFGYSRSQRAEKPGNCSTSSFRGGSLRDYCLGLRVLSVQEVR